MAPACAARAAVPKGASEVLACAQGRALGANGEGMSEEMIDGLVQVPQKEARLLLESAALYLELGKPKEAEEVLVGVCALLPHSDVPRVQLGNVHFAQGRYARALKFHQEALKLNPQSALAMAHIGEAQLFLKKTDDGVASLQKAIELEPQSDAADFARALLQAYEDGALA